MAEHLPTPAQSTLYQVKSSPERFGTFLTMNSVGRAVLEMKGEGGKVETFDMADIEEVVPYTVSIECLSSGSSSVIHISVPKGKVKKGDVLLISGMKQGLWLVIGEDTRSKSTSRIGTVSVVKTEPVEL